MLLECAARDGDQSMPRPASQVTKLKTLIRLAQELLRDAESSGVRAVNRNSSSQNKNGSIAKRARRSGKELVAFRKMLKAERKKGLPVAEIAREHGISSAYIYGLE
jgi:hypothetical protein